LGEAVSNSERLELSGGRGNHDRRSSSKDFRLNVDAPEWRRPHGNSNFLTPSSKCEFVAAGGTPRLTFIAVEVAAA